MEGKTLRHLLRISLLVAACLLLIASSALAVNLVEVVGQDELAPNSTVEVKIKISNDVAVKGLFIPLVVRSDSVNGTGALTRPTSGSMKWRERLPRLGGPISDIVVTNTLTTSNTAGGTCKTNSPGGFAAAPQCDQDTLIADSCFTTTPWALLLGRNKIFSSDLTSGADTSGSVVLEFGLNDQEGCFIIDTTCVNPANHLVYIESPGGAPITPDFMMARVCVGIPECAYAGLVEPPGLNAPRDDSVGERSVEFSWSPVEFASKYEIQVDSISDAFTNPFVTDTVSTTSDVVVFPIQDTDTLEVFWRVRALGDARDGVDACPGPWSEPFMYTDVKVVNNSGVPESYGLSQNYPNPFNAGTVINFTNRRDGHVKLEVFNILGQSVITLVDEYKPMGVYSVDWTGLDRNGEEVPSGMYFYRFTTKDYSDVKKMTLLK